ncbi:MAG: thiamine pyrophosphate-dependent enzyme, partial [Solirubrobacteraceae bacterium]
LAPRAVVVAGRDGGDGDAVATFARRAGYPVLADPLSGARRGPTAIATYDLLLRDRAFTAAVEPELVIRIGDLPTSKPLRGWLGSLGHVEQVALHPEASWQDPAAVLSAIHLVDPAATLAAWPAPDPPDPDWLAAWQAADAVVARTIDRELACDELSEPRVARLLGEALPGETILVVASSMPIRDVELYLPAAGHLPRVVSNRGANGIDGSVSTAFGIAAASPGRPVVLLIGDVALAHDIGGLMTARRLGLPLTIVLVNNDGGGIFHFLPVSGQVDGFEEHIATPHGLEFEHAATLYGLGYARVESADELAAALQDDHGDRGARIVEVRTDRAANLALHRRVADAALAALHRSAAGVTPPAAATSPGA